ncbi:MAG: CDP-alcohol phosphatidyltransferase family protein [Patescibacteria group bacterium]
MKKNLANLISSLRFTAPIILFATDWSIQAKLIYCIALIPTDILDGLVARVIGNKNGIGKLIDSTADRILYGSGLIFLFSEKLMKYWIVLPLILGEIILAVPVGYGIFLIIKKEIKKNKIRSVIQIYQKINEQVSENFVVNVFGKIKGVVYSIGITLLAINIFKQLKSLEVIYSAMFISGFFFCGIAFIDYYKKFQKWNDTQEKFFK